MKNWAEALAVRPGVTAIIGGGGKTRLLRTLGEELAEAGHTVLLCTTTKIRPFEGLENLLSPSEAAIAEALARRRLACVAEVLPETGKLAAPAIPMAQLTALAEYVLAEADGSAQRPLKAHAAHEPVIPPESVQTIYVTGASGFGRPIAEAAHRPALYARRAGVAESALASAETEAAVRLAEGLPDRLLVNQAETPQAFRAAEILAERLPCPVLAGSLWKGEIAQCL